MERPSKDLRYLILSFIVTFILMILTSAWIGRGVFRLSYLQMDMDEALHANRGMDMVSEFLNRDWEELWWEFSKPEWYPPGHGVLSGMWSLALGPGIQTARLYSTFFYMLFGLLLWWSIRELLPEAPPLLYLIPPLFLISDALHSVHAGLSMLELPAITLAFAGILFFNRARRRKSLIDHLLALVFGLLCLFTKYNYGIVLFTVFAISHALIAFDILSSRRDNKPSNRQLYYILSFWMAFGLVVVLWFLLLGHWQWLTTYAVAQPEGYTFWSWANLSYYPKRLWNDSLTWLAILLSIGGVIQLVRKRLWLWGVIPYLLFFCISLAMLTLTLQNNPRFSMILLPSLWITAAVGAYLLIVDLSPAWFRGIIYGLLIIALLFAGLDTFYNFQSQLFVAYENANDGINQAYQFIADVLDVSQQHDLDMVMLGRSDQWNGPALHFHLESTCLSTGNRCKINVLDSRELRKGWPEQEYPPEVKQQRLDDALGSADYRIHFFQHPEAPEGWVLIAEKEFTFERLHKKTEVIWVSIYKPGAYQVPD